VSQRLKVLSLLRHAGETGEARHPAVALSSERLFDMEPERPHHYQDMAA
jgi:hypothetical protein